MNYKYGVCPHIRKVRSLDKMLNAVKDFFDLTIRYLQLMSLPDIVDILLVAFLIYKLYTLMNKTSGAQVFKGLILILIATQVSAWLGFYTLNFALSNAIQLGVIALVIVFQPELRRMLEHVGRGRLSDLFDDGEGDSGMNHVIHQVVEACAGLSGSRTGALIVFEKEMRLSGIQNNGTTLNAEVTAELVRNIFYPKAPLHDGAVVISQGRLAAAGCVLPLSPNRSLSSELGTRHRAGVGMSEASDAVVVIISEETGSISVAVNGMLKRHLSPQTLEKLLSNELLSKDGELRRVNLAFWRRKKDA